jgi:hypothetical protein
VLTPGIVMPDMRRAAALRRIWSVRTTPGRGPRSLQAGKAALPSRNGSSAPTRRATDHSVSEELAHSPIHVPIFEVAKKLPRLHSGSLTSIAKLVGELDVSALVPASITKGDNMIDFNILVTQWAFA